MFDAVRLLWARREGVIEPVNDKARIFAGTTYIHRGFPRGTDCSDLTELMGRLGYSAQGAARHYQRAAAERYAEIARRLSNWRTANASERAGPQPGDTTLEDFGRDISDA